MIFGMSELGALYDWLAHRYVAESNVPVLLVDYRTAPEFPHPVPVQDCFAALVWLAEHANELGVDPARVAVMGDSAGGGLAAAVCLMARDRGCPAVALQVLIYPMLDDRTALPDPQLVPFVTWTYDDNITGWQALLGDSVGRDGVTAYAAPARATDLSLLPPTYIDVGDLDIFRDEDITYARRLAAAGVATELHVHPVVRMHSRDWPPTPRYLAGSSPIASAACGLCSRPRIQPRRRLTTSSKERPSRTHSGLGYRQQRVVNCDRAQRTGAGATLLRSIRAGACGDLLRGGGAGSVGRSGLPRFLDGLLRRPVGAAGHYAARGGDRDLL